jgi:hypothetical protein
MILLAADFDIDVLRYSHRGPLVEFFAAIPLVWLVVLLVFLGLAYLQVKHTQSGYTYQPYMLVLASIGASILIGVFFFVTGFGHSVDRTLSASVPRYNMIVQHKAERWAHPERGLLAGTIGEMDEPEFILEDVYGSRWRIRLKNEREDIAALFSVGDRVGLVGEQIGEHLFLAHSIRPWAPKREFRVLHMKQGFFRE